MGKGKAKTVPGRGKDGGGLGGKSPGDFDRLDGSVNGVLLKRFIIENERKRGRKARALSLEYREREGESGR